MSCFLFQIVNLTAVGRIEVGQGKEMKLREKRSLRWSS